MTTSPQQGGYQGSFGTEGNPGISATPGTSGTPPQETTLAALSPQVLQLINPNVTVGQLLELAAAIENTARTNTAGGAQLTGFVLGTDKFFLVSG